jgi:uncharacterized RDD family membrane protein YckC
VRLLREEPGDLPLIIHMDDVGAFPSRSTHGDNVAGVLPRLVAALVDAAVLAAVNGLVAGHTLVIFRLPLSAEGFVAVQTWPMAVFYLALAVLYLAGLTYQAGQTLGKRLTGIRVVDDAGDDVSLGRAVARAVVWLASLGTLGAFWAPALFDLRRRTVHDRLTGTLVINA